MSKCRKLVMYGHQVCAKALFEQNVSYETVKAAEDIFAQDPQLSQVLSSPQFDVSEKAAVIDRIFPKEICAFLKVMAEFGHMADIDCVFAAYEDLRAEKNKILKAELFCAEPVSVETKEKFRETLKKKYGVNDVLLEVTEDSSLIGGYALMVNGTLFDKSVKGTIKALQDRLIRR